MRPPRVTVLTTVYNGARYLDEAIDSILTEELADFEYVIVDDGSTDGTAAVLARAATRDPRIILLRNDTNRGIAASANRGLAVARGDYIAPRFRIVRAVKAKRLTNTAVLLMTKVKVVPSLQHLTQAMRWNPLVTIARLARVASSVLQKRMSR